MQNREAEKLLCFFVTKRKKRTYIYKYILRRLIYDKQNFEKDSLCGYVSVDLRINDSYGNQSRYAGDGNCNAGVSKHLEQKLYIGYLRHKLDIFGNAALKQVNVTEDQDGTAEEKKRRIQDNRDMECVKNGNDSHDGKGETYQCSCKLQIEGYFHRRIGNSRILRIPEIIDKRK